MLATGVTQAIIRIVEPLRAARHRVLRRALLIKFALLLAIVGFGAFNRTRVLPRLRNSDSPGAAGVLLRRTLRTEAAIALVVLGTTGALAGYAANTVAAGPYSTDAASGPRGSR